MSIARLMVFMNLTMLYKKEYLPAKSLHNQIKEN